MIRNRRDITEVVPLHAPGSSSHFRELGTEETALFDLSIFAVLYTGKMNTGFVRRRMTVCNRAQACQAEVLDCIMVPPVFFDSTQTPVLLLSLESHIFLVSFIYFGRC